MKLKEIKIDHINSNQAEYMQSTLRRHTHKERKQRNGESFVSQSAAIYSCHDNEFIATVSVLYEINGTDGRRC